MSAEPIQQVYGAGTPFDLSKPGTTVPEDHGATLSAESHMEAIGREVPPHAQTDPELAWLGSPEAHQYEGHWVALDPDTGKFLGMADANTDFRRWQIKGATIVFVESPGFRTGV
ncbi:MAG TPA: hypothetical protein VGH27_33480 [Streptosporangiaceae bacterium]|jgi:hypothetical protein